MGLRQSSIICSRTGGPCKMPRAPVFPEATTAQGPEHPLRLIQEKTRMDVIFPPAFFRWKHAPTHTLTEINLSNPSPSITPCLPSCGGRDVALALQRCEGRGHGQGCMHPRCRSCVHCLTDLCHWGGPTCLVSVFLTFTGCPVRQSHWSWKGTRDALVLDRTAVPHTQPITSRATGRHGILSSPRT